MIGNDLELAAGLLSKGELVAIPTETVYGLAANALNPDAALRIFEAKERPAFDPLIVHIPSVESMELYAEEIPEVARKLALRFWPGPLTLVLPKKAIVPDIISSGLSTVGLRMPNHPLTLSLLKLLPFPLAAPSANPFGYISPTTPQHVEDQLGTKIAYILDGGPCAVGVESTIVGFEDGEVFVYRLGGLTLEDIRQIAPDAELKLNSSSNPQAPGMLASHYAPRKPIYRGNIAELLLTYTDKKVGVLSFTSDFSENASVIAMEILSPSGNLQEAAGNLFAALRRLDALDLDLILTEEVPDVSLGRAINDRLRRATHSSGH